MIIARSMILLGAAVIAGACQSTLIRIDRSASGSVDRDIDFQPLPGPDGHLIPFPADPLTNCIDVLQADGGRHDEIDQAFCASSDAVAGFLGYTAAWGAVHHVSWLTSEAVAAEPAARAVLAAYGGIGSPQPIASFLHVSDVQIREPAAKLGGTAVSATLDRKIPTFEHDPDQELYSGFMYAAVIETANAEIALARTAPDAARPPPAMMIHTGDSVDAGLVSEFARFQSYSDRLSVPWYQAIGNHDVLAFGNLSLHPDHERRKHGIAKQPEHDEFIGDRCGADRARCTCTRVADLVREPMLVSQAPDNCGGVAGIDTRIALAPSVLRRICITHDVHGDRLVMAPDRFENSVNAFIAAHTWPMEATQPNTAPPAGPAARAGSPEDALRRAYASVPAPGLLCGTFAGDAPSRIHGFDLVNPARQAPPVTPAAISDSQHRSSQAPLGGYYCFELTKSGDRSQDDPPRVWAIVLNTSNDVGAYGDIPPDELKWLRDVLTHPQIGPSDLILVFGHHPLYDIYAADVRGQLLDLLTFDPRVVAYFAGHVHWPRTRLVHPRAEGAGHHLWEILAPAVLTYPQQARQVTIKQLGELGYLEILSFAPRGNGSSAAQLSLSRAGAEFDFCRGDRTRCVGARPSPPPRVASHARLFFRWPGEAKTAPKTPPLRTTQSSCPPTAAPRR